MAKLLGIEEVLRIARIGGLTASRAGAAFTVTRADVEGNKYITEVRVLHQDGSWRAYEAKGASNPALRDDGLLAFTGTPLGEGEGKEKREGTWILLASPGGGLRRVAFMQRSVWGLEWLGDKLVVGGYVVDDKKVDPDGDYVVIDGLPVWEEGEGFAGGVTRQLFLVDPESGRVEKLTSGPWGVSDYTVCGPAIYYSAPESWEKPYIHKLLRMKPGGEPELIVEGLSIYGLACAGETPIFGAHRLERGVVSHYKLHTVRDGRVECLTCGALDRSVHPVPGSMDGDPLFTYTDSGRSVLARLRDWINVEDLARGDYYIHAVAEGGGAIYAVVSSPTEPPEVYRLGDGGALHRLTGFNRWVTEGYSLSEPRRLTIESDGDTVEGWVLLPPEGAPRRGDKLPLILFIHGGPKGMYGYYFHYEMQLWAAQGFVVAYANPRGSDGYSEEFADIRGRMGETDYKQLIDFLDAVAEKYPVDTERMAVTGISYGGFMTNVMVVKAKRFRAAVSENGIADWVADYWASDIGYWWNKDYVGGTPLDSPENYIRQSPAYHAANTETPLLIIHSMEDRRCFIDQALAMHTALRSHGKKSRLVVFMKGGHGHSVTADPRHRRKRLQLKLSWVKEHLGIKDEDSERKQH